VRLGEFDPVSTNPHARLGGADADTAAHRDSALRAARESIILLNNSAGVLPLDKRTLASVAVVGYLANCTRLNGCAKKGGGVEMGGKNDYNPAFIVSPLDGIVGQFNASRVVYAAGISDGANSANTSGFPAALAAARAADMTVVVVGLDGDSEGEGHDRGNTSLGGAQPELVQELLAAVGADRLVVVFVNGGSLSPDWIKAHVPTVVEAMEGGQSGGTALAEVLAGDVAPSGVLPYTMYPVGYLGQVAHQDMSMRTAPGRSYRFYAGAPLWPFGFSLSYTSWTAEWAAGAVLPRVLSPAALEAGVTLKVRLTNTGKVDSSKALLFFAAVTLPVSQPRHRWLVCS
jgi:beta-D-xylosidase 4